MARRRQRISSYATPTRRAGSVLMSSKPASRKRRRGPFPWRALLVLVVVGAAIAAAVVVVLRGRAADDRRREAAVAFAAAWERRDVQALWELSERATRPRLGAFERQYAESDDAAGVRRVEIGPPGELRDDAVRLPVTVRTDDFGRLQGEVDLAVVDEDGAGRVAWSPQLRLPGLRRGEDVRRRAGPEPAPGEVLAADGSRLADDPGLASFAAGLQKRYADRLTGHGELALRFGDRVVASVEREPGRDVRTTLDPGLSTAAAGALGGRLGGVAVIRPRDGAVLALAGIAVSAPQPPGSTFKIVTLAGALEAGITDTGESFPVQTAATLSGVELRNAGGESCGGSLAVSFAESCNSVFAPLGAELGAERLLDISERFGFNGPPGRVPGTKQSRVEPDLRDDLAIGAAAIGQDRDLATPLQMATVGATIANAGVRAEPKLVRGEPRRTRRVVSRDIAGTVRDLMVGAVEGGTGTAAALPGVSVAGKTGTAELVPGSTDPNDSDAWFVAFAPAEDPQVAIAVLLVRAGFGGDTAAPVARTVLDAAL